ncbi:unnamed protein product [Phaeothamnion confervicola]
MVKRKTDEIAVSTLQMGYRGHAYWISEEARSGASTEGHRKFLRAVDDADGKWQKDCKRLRLNNDESLRDYLREKFPRKKKDVRPPLRCIVLIGQPQTSWVEDTAAALESASIAYWIDRTEWTKPMLERRAAEVQKVLEEERRLDDLNVCKRRITVRRVITAYTDNAERSFFAAGLPEPHLTHVLPTDLADDLDKDSFLSVVLGFKPPPRDNSEGKGRNMGSDDDSDEEPQVVKTKRKAAPSKRKKCPSSDTDDDDKVEDNEASAPTARPGKIGKLAAQSETRHRIAKTTSILHTQAVLEQEGSKLPGDSDDDVTEPAQTPDTPSAMQAPQLTLKDLMARGQRMENHHKAIEARMSLIEVDVPKLRTALSAARTMKRAMAGLDYATWLDDIKLTESIAQAQLVLEVHARIRDDVETAQPTEAGERIAQQNEKTMATMPEKVRTLLYKLGLAVTQGKEKQEEVARRAAATAAAAQTAAAASTAAPTATKSTPTAAASSRRGSPLAQLLAPPGTPTSVVDPTSDPAQLAQLLASNKVIHDSKALITAVQALAQDNRTMVTAVQALEREVHEMRKTMKDLVIKPPPIYSLQETEQAEKDLIARIHQAAIDGCNKAFYRSNVLPPVPSTSAAGPQADITGDHHMTKQAERQSSPPTYSLPALSPLNTGDLELLAATSPSPSKDAGVVKP